MRWGNVRAFLSWAFFARHEADLTESQQAALDRMVRCGGSADKSMCSLSPRPNPLPHPTQNATVRRRYGQRVQLAEGTNAEITPMAMTLQPMKWHHRPLLAYLFITVIPLAALHLFLRAVLGLRRYTLEDGHAYWHRPGKKQGEKEGAARLPLLFFHGVGGLGLYAALVWRLARARAGPLVLVEIPHVGLTLQSFEALGPVSGCR